MLALYLNHESANHLFSFDTSQPIALGVVVCE